MATKSEIARKINRILGLHLGFERLTKADLEKLHDFIKEPLNLVKLGVKNGRNKLRKDYLQRPVEEFLKGLEERPLLNIDLLPDDGILGLGIGKKLKERLRDRRGL